jgi:hypothetical protein
MIVNEESAHEQPKRCWLVSSDVGEEAISVTDSKTGTLVAPAPLAQVIATPAKHRERYARVKGALPILVVSMPGVRRLSIGCMEPAQGLAPCLKSVYRFSWRYEVPQEFDLAPQLEGSQPMPSKAGSSSPLYSQSKYIECYAADAHLVATRRDSPDVHRVC